MALNGKTDCILVNGNHAFDDRNILIAITASGETDNKITSSIRQTEILRCFAQYLLEKNYKDTYEKLVSESGVVLENHYVAKLRESVLSGNWVEAEEALSNLKYEVNSDEHLRQMQFLILEQRILEAMEDKNFLHGVELLRERLTPMNLNRDRVHHLATCLMYKEISELHNMASWKGKNGGSREILVDKLQGFIPAQVMLPPKRLETLFNMAIKFQISKCPFHNDGVNLTEQSLLQNHDCGKKNFPTTIIQDIKINKSELWVCKFSPNGIYLAVGGKNINLDIFNVNLGTFKVSKFSELQCGGSINFISWSSDSKKVAACSAEEQGGVSVFEIPSGKCACTVRVNDDETYNCTAFLPDDNKLAIGSLKGVIYIVDTSDQGRTLVTVDGYRAQSMVAFRRGLANYDSLLVADTHRRIREYQFGYDTSSNDSNCNIPTANDSTANLPGMLGGFASAILGFDSNAASLSMSHPTHSSASVTSTIMGPFADINMAAAYAINVSSHSAPTSASTSSESISVTQATNVTASTTVSTISTSSNPLVIHHAFSSPGITNQMLQLVSNTAISTPTPAWMHNTVPVITSVDSIIPSLNSATMTNVISSTATVTSSMNTTASNLRLPFTKLKDETLFEADSAIQSIILSETNERLLTSLNKVGLCMWHLPSKQIIQRFVGAEQKKFTLHPSFGGFNEEYVACGSENGYLYIWHHATNTSVQQLLLMNDNNVGCVHWNPNNIKMIACINDAGHLFIIGPSQFGSKDQQEMDLSRTYDTRGKFSHPKRVNPIRTRAPMKQNSPLYQPKNFLKRICWNWPFQHCKPEKILAGDSYPSN